MADPRADDLGPSDQVQLCARSIEGLVDPIDDGSEERLTTRRKPGKVEGLPRTGPEREVLVLDGVRRLFENSTVCLIVNAKF